MQDYNLTIPFFDAAHNYTLHKDELDKAIQHVLNGGQYINGTDVNVFTEALKSYLNTSYVVSCANGTDALQLALLALDLKPGDEVIIPTFNFIAAAEVVALLGLIPVFVDLLENDFNADYAQLHSIITARTKAIIVVHLFGAPANLDFVLEVASKYNLFVIEDVAQSLGSNFKSKKLGTIGHIGCTSFFPTKNLACFGDGGATFTSSEFLATRMKMIANHGQVKKYDHQLIGLNSRLDTIQAAILNVKLKYLDLEISQRRHLAKRYFEALCEVKNLILPIEKSDTFHTFNQYCILLASESERNLLKLFLEENSVQTMIYYNKPTHLQVAFLNYGNNVGNFSRAEDICKRVLAIPLRPSLSFESQDYIIKLILGFFKRYE